MLSDNELKKIDVKIAANHAINVPVMEGFNSESSRFPSTAEEALMLAVQQNAEKSMSEQPALNREQAKLDALFSHNLKNPNMTPEGKELAQGLRELLKQDGPEMNAGYYSDAPNMDSGIAAKVKGLDMESPKAPGFMDKVKDYLPSVGVGAGAGAIAGIPVALIAHALTADKGNKNLRSYLKSALLGALLGGGLGAAGGAAYKAFGIGEPTMSETPLGAHNKMRQEIAKSMFNFGLGTPKKDNLTAYEKGLSKKELAEMQALRGF